MTGIVISSRDAERLARSFNDLIGPKGLLAIRRACGDRHVGGGADDPRKGGGAPGSANPAYKLRMARKIPVARMKASKRKITRRRGRASLTLTLPGGDKISFRSIHRDGASFRLLRAGPLPERELGGVYTNAAKAFTADGYPELYDLRRAAEKDLVKAVSEGLKTHLAKGQKN